MQHGGDAQACAETLGVGGDGEQRLSGGFEQQIVDDRLVVISDITDRCRQGDPDMGLLHR